MNEPAGAPIEYLYATSGPACSSVLPLPVFTALVVWNTLDLVDSLDPLDGFTALVVWNILDLVNVPLPPLIERVVTPAAAAAARALAINKLPMLIPPPSFFLRETLLVAVSARHNLALVHVLAKFLRAALVEIMHLLVVCVRVCVASC